MLSSPSDHRCGDQAFAKSPEPSTPIASFLTEIQRNLHIAETSYCTAPAPVQVEPAYLKERKQKERKQEEHTQSPSPPFPNHQSLPDLHNISSSHESPETDPAFIQALWREVISSGNAHNPAENLLDINMESATEYVLSEQYAPPAPYDPQGFSTAAFSAILKLHQVTIEEHVVPSGLVASFWLSIQETVKAAPPKVISELDSSKVWRDNDDGTKATAEAKADAEDLAARLKALILDHDSTQVDLQEFVTHHILRGCPLPGVRVFNNLKMFEGAIEPYRLISTRQPYQTISNIEPYHPIPTTEPSTSGISTQPIARKSIKRKFSATQSTRSSRAAPPAPSAPPLSASQNAAQPTYFGPTILRKLILPRDTNDFAYWLEASELRPLGTQEIAERTFVSTGTKRKTSPYLSLAFVNSECDGFMEMRRLVKHKIAVYGSTAIYNRHRLYANGMEFCRNRKSNITQLDRSVYILHFGLAFLKAKATLYVFRCEEENPRETSQATAWQGCNMSRVGEWTLTAPDELTDMLYHLQIVADWAKRVYVPGLHADLTQLS